VTIYGAASSGPQAIGTPWTSPLNTSTITECAGTGIQLDTMIVFDRLASRWVIAAKAVRAGSLNGTPIEVYYLCIAVSNGPDVTSTSPSFGWYAYSYSLDGILPLVTPPSKPSYYLFPDWPKLGTWEDAYYVSMDMQDNKNGSAELGVAVCAFNRQKMLAGVPPDVPPANQLTACATETTPLDPLSLTYLAHSLIPADIEGGTSPPPGTPEYLVSIENPNFSQGALSSSVFNLWEAQVVWPTTSGTSPSLTLTQTQPAVSAYTPGCYLFVAGAPAITNCVPEPAYQNVGQTVDSVGDRFMPRFAYRNFGTYGSFLVSHTVQTNLVENSLQTGIRWYELRPNGAGIPAVYQEGLVSPDNLLFRFLPSIAQDKNGNAAVGYSFSNRLTNPGIAFSYWDLGTINAPAAEVTIFDGPSEEVTTAPVPGRGQWGTYSSMTVDPVDDCTFWYVNEYWPTITDWATRIAYFKLPSCQ
jgi:hypothetical protein